MCGTSDNTGRSHDVVNEILRRRLQIFHGKPASARGRLKNTGQVEQSTKHLPRASLQR
jgi:hypothetical protein